MKTYEGIHVPLVTPFLNGLVDWESLGLLIDAYIDSGVAGIVPCGSTGECSTLSFEEHIHIIDYCVKRVAGRVLVIAGTGSNNTKEALELTSAAEKVGADAALVVSPYYNRPSQQGIYHYFEEIAESVNIDIIIYNIPSRTSTNIDFNTVTSLSEIKNIKGIKEGSGDIQQMTDLAYYFADEDFSVLTGEDTLLYQLSALGGNGGIMAAACVYPQQLIKVHQLISAGQYSQARRLDMLLRPTIKALFLETNPVVVKYAVAEKFKVPYELRKPLLSLQRKNRELIDAAMSTLDKVLQD